MCHHLMDNRVCLVKDILFGAGYLGVSSSGDKPYMSVGGYLVWRWISRCITTWPALLISVSFLVLHLFMFVFEF